MKTFLSAEEACEILGISRPTLYAYVSRGLIRSDEGDSKKRTRRYYAEDVERLRRRQEQRRDPDKSAVETLNWGVPIIDSALTRIADGRLYYREHDAVELARTRSFEEVASLLWTGSFDRKSAQSTPVALPDVFRAVHEQLHRLKPYDRLRILLPLAAACDPAAVDLRPEGVASTGGRIIGTMTAILTGQSLREGGVASTLAAYWSVDFPYAVALMNSALILCADHELNTSAFTARCVASTGADPYAVVEAAMAALGGYKHGGMAELVEEFVKSCEAKSPGELRSTVYERLRRGQSLPGFGHTLYPDGDPRGRHLLDMLSTAGLFDPAARAVVDAVHEVTGEHPNVDFGLVALSTALELPAGSSLLLFALGRTAGWIAHAIEQYQTGRLIRPRARYTGERDKRDV